MSALAHVLVVDDDPDIRNVLSLLLKPSYNLSEAEDGVAAVEFIKKNPGVDLIILDVMMPRMSGIEACAEIRNYSKAPVLFLTAKSAEEDRISAYSSGGDDFLPKPFSQAELLAKVNSLLRRYTEYRGKPEEIVELGQLCVDFGNHTVTNAGVALDLTDKEHAILEYMIKNRGTTLNAKQIYEAVWEEVYLPGSGSTVMVHILNLRRKIEEDPSNPKILRTVWGKGYQID